MLRLIGWAVLALGGGLIVWCVFRRRLDVGGAAGFAIAVAGALFGALAGRYLEIAERIDHRLEDLFGNIEVDDVSTWVPTVAGSTLVLVAYAWFRRRRRHVGATTRAHETTTKDGSS